ncbi:MAG: hypothetical protein D6820_08360, partial [Lentisphaerae bacterium]
MVQAFCPFFRARLKMLTYDNSGKFAMHLKELVDHLKVPAIIVDVDGQIVEANIQALPWLQQHFSEPYHFPKHWLPKLHLANKTNTPLSQEFSTPDHENLILQLIPLDDGRHVMILPLVISNGGIHQESILRNRFRMAAIGKLAGSIAHDLNNILGGLIGYASLLETVLEAQPEQRN